MVASWSAHAFFSQLKRNARASAAMQQWLTFLWKRVVLSRHDLSAALSTVVAMHQHVLKSTTSDSGRVSDAQNRRSIWSISFVWFIWLVSSNQIDQKDQTDQIDQTNRELPLA